MSHVTTGICELWKHKHYKNTMNTFCWNIYKSMNTTGMLLTWFCWHITSRRFQTFINESYLKKLGHTKQYEQVLLEYYEHLSVKVTYRHYGHVSFNQSKLP